MYDPSLSTVVPAGPGMPPETTPIETVQFGSFGARRSYGRLRYGRIYDSYGRATGYGRGFGYGRRSYY